MNIKKLALCFVAVFITIFATDFVIHQVFMKSTYEATAHLWRPQDQMSGYLPFMFLGQAVFALFVSWIFSHGYKGGGPIEGVRFGLLLTGLCVGQNLIMYAVSPWEFSMVGSWIVLGGVQSVIIGVVCSLVYGRK